MVWDLGNLFISGHRLEEQLYPFFVLIGLCLDMIVWNVFQGCSIELTISTNFISRIDSFHVTIEKRQKCNGGKLKIFTKNTLSILLLLPFCVGVHLSVYIVCVCVCLCVGVCVFVCVCLCVCLSVSLWVKIRDVSFFVLINFKTFFLKL